MGGSNIVRKSSDNCLLHKLMVHLERNSLRGLPEIGRKKNVTPSLTHQDAASEGVKAVGKKLFCAE